MSRYIDADELKDFIFRWGDHSTVDDCIQWIEQTETADVRENVRGEWLPHTIDGNVWSIDKDVCSVCKETFYQISETGCVWNFCPNCGADMRGKDD